MPGRAHERGAAPEPQLAELVRSHYDNPWLRRLAGEIHFDDELSEAEVDVAVRLLEQATGTPLADEVFLPCAGTLRHVPPLLRRGVRRIVAVDLSRSSLDAGLARYGEAAGRRLVVHHGDVRDVAGTVGERTFAHVALISNTLGDITDPAGHLALLRALARALAPGGALVFDYVADRYCPAPGEVVETVWPETLTGDDGPRPITDRRRRWFEPGEDGTGVLRCALELRDEAGDVVDRHEYARLVVPDHLLREQFAACGLELRDAGPVAGLSPYHRRRLDTRDDLGMLGAPDHFYVAVRPS